MFDRKDSYVSSAKMQQGFVDLYRQLHKKDTNHETNHLYALCIKKKCAENHWSTVFDYGCGKGALIKKIRENGIEANGYDPANERWNDDAVLAKHFDLVVCINVLEHCPPGTIKPELSKLRDMAHEGVLLHISCREAAITLPDGRNAHLSVHEPKWWLDRVREVFKGPWKIENSWFESKSKTLTIFVKNTKKDSQRCHIENLEIFARHHVGLSDTGEPRKIAVVGSGPVDKEDKLQIEAADVVIRFNDYNRRKGFSTMEAGNRCDVLFTQFDLREMEDTPTPSMVCIAVPSPFHQDRVIEKSEEWYWQSQITMFNPYSMRLICRDALRLRDSDGSQHPLPTVGFQMLWQLERWVKPECHEVFVTGFTWHVDIEMKTAAKIPLDSDRFPEHFNHSYLREVKWCADNLIQNKAFVFGKLTKEALYFVRWHCRDQIFENNFHSSSQGDWRYNKTWEEAGNALVTIRDRLQSKTTDWILDMGSGPRSMCEFFTHKEHLVVIDPLATEYQKMGKSRLAVAHEVFPKPGEELIDKLQGRFNIIWCHNALDHCHNWRTVLQNIWHYLRRGGIAYIGTDCFPPRSGHLGIDKTELGDEIETLGFRVVWQKTKEKGESIWIRQESIILKKP